MIDPLTAWELSLTDGHGRWQSEAGDITELPIAAWRAEPDPGDQALLDRCLGPTLDVGCGPGRLVAGLTRRGVPALGVDLSALAVAMTRARGGLALRRDVFTLGLGHRRWHHLLLADGNVGIGGDPARMLRRCRDLMAPGGSVLVDLEPPGSGLRTGRVRMVGPGEHSSWFSWAWLGVDAVQTVAESVGLLVRDVWSAPGSIPRWQAELEAGPAEIADLEQDQDDVSLAPLVACERPPRATETA